MRTLTLLLLSIVAFTSCEKVVLDNVDDNAKGNLIVSTQVQDEVGIGQAIWQSTRSTRPLAEFCTRISYVLYQDGQRVKYVNQKQDDDGFGSARLSIGAGQYTLLIVGHSGASNASTTDINKITFSGKLTDTFVFSQDIELADEAKNINALLTRTVAMVRLNVTGDIPSYAARLKFYYTGGSSTLDGVTRRGCVDSRQTEYRDVSTTQRTYDIFTFPHEEEDILKITITAYDAEGNELIERVISDVPVRTNHITTISGDFFDGSNGAFISVGATPMADDTWAGTINYPSE